MLRLDKLLSELGLLSRRECKKALRAGLVEVNGIKAAAPEQKIDPEKDTVCFEGKKVSYRPFLYLLLNKPAGVVSATEDGGRTVLDLLPPEMQKRGLFPCGRLDKNTVGVMLLTNDGALAHALLSPGHHVEKVYFFRSERAVTSADAARLEAGVDIGGYRTAPCRVEMRSDREGFITLREGKYHQIKRMLQAVCNKVIYLERVSFAGLTADPALSRGQWRFLLPEEEEVLRLAARTKAEAPAEDR